MGENGLTDPARRVLSERVMSCRPGATTFRTAMRHAPDYPASAPPRRPVDSSPPPSKGRTLPGSPRAPEPPTTFPGRTQRSRAAERKRNLALFAQLLRWFGLQLRQKPTTAGRRGRGGKHERDHVSPTGTEMAKRVLARAAVGPSQRAHVCPEL